MSLKHHVLACALIATLSSSGLAQSGLQRTPAPGRYLVSEAPLTLPAVQPAQHLEGTATGQPFLLPYPSTNDQPISLVGHCSSCDVGAYVTGHDSCSNGCGGSANGCCGDCQDCCCLPAWTHRSGMFGEYLVLRARNADIAYAVPIDGGINPPILPPPVQRGAVAVTDPEFDSSYRVGGTLALDCKSSITATYSRFESNTTDSISVTAPLALRQLVLHPQSLNATADYLDATANLGLDYHLGDIDYRAIFYSTDTSALNYLVGVRYVRFEQDFDGIFTNAGTTELLDTGVDFEGIGLRLGLDGERHVGCNGLLVYGRGTANLIGGESSGYYRQSTSPAAPTVDTSWSAARMITILELEVGAGWQSCCGRYRVTAGYQYNAWQDLVTADKFIEGVQNNSFVDMTDTITFDGLNARFEYRW